MMNKYLTLLFFALSVPLVSAETFRAAEWNGWKNLEQELAAVREWEKIAFSRTISVYKSKKTIKLTSIYGDFAVVKFSFSGKDYFGFTQSGLIDHFHVDSVTDNEVIYYRDEFSLKEGPSFSERMKGILRFGSGELKLWDESTLSSSSNDGTFVSNHYEVTLGTELFKVTTTYQVGGEYFRLGVAKLDALKQRFENYNLRGLTRDGVGTSIYPKVVSFDLDGIPLFEVEDENVRIRESPSTDAKILGKTSFGQPFYVVGFYPKELTVGGTKGFWIKIRQGSIEGYLWSVFLPHRIEGAT